MAILIEKNIFKSVNHNYNKILKFDWLSAVLISALTGQCNGRVHATACARLNVFCFPLRAKNSRKILCFNFKTLKQQKKNPCWKPNIVHQRLHAISKVLPGLLTATCRLDSAVIYSAWLLQIFNVRVLTKLQKLILLSQPYYIVWFFMYVHIITCPNVMCECFTCPCRAR